VALKPKSELTDNKWNEVTGPPRAASGHLSREAPANESVGTPRFSMEFAAVILYYPRPEWTMDIASPR
jgi:hypothetical protein